MTQTTSPLPSCGVVAHTDPPRDRLRWAPWLVLVVAVVPYLRVLDAPFVFDDVKLVVENPLLRVEGEEMWSRVAASFQILSRDFDDLDVRENYRPLRFLSYLLDWRLARWQAGDSFQASDPPVLFFHLQNIFWHALNALLVFLLGRSLLRGDFGALALALLFALHPIETEAVTYISGRRDVLSTFFFLAALLLCVRGDPRERVSFVAVLFAPILLALGLLAKEMVVTLPAVLLVIDVVRRARVEWRRVAVHVALWVVAAFFIHAALSNRSLIAAPVAGTPENALLTAPRLVWRYLALLAAPIAQSIDYSYDAIPVTRGLLDPATTCLSLLGVLGLLVVALLAAWRRRVVLAIGLLWLVGTLVPVLQIVPIPERFAERFAYLPSIGAFLVAAAALVRLRAREPFLAWSALLVVALGLLVLCVRRNGDWETRIALWGSAVEARPRCARAWIGHGEALQLSERLPEAEISYTRALEILDAEDSPPPLRVGHALRARTARGGVRFAIGKLAEAEEDLAAVLASRDSDGREIASSPDYSRVRFDYAGVLLKSGRVDEAAREYLAVTRIGGPPGAVPSAWLQLAQIALAAKDVPLAIERYRASVDHMKPGEPGRILILLSLADLLSAQKDADGAWRTLEEALVAQPTRAEEVGILLRMARVLDERGEIAASVERLEQALDLDPVNEHVLVTLAGVEMNRSRYDRAEELYRRLLRAKPGDRRAQQGLNQLRMREDVSAQPDGAVGRLVRRLAGAEKNLEAGRLPLARDIFNEILREAGEAGARSIVVDAYLGVARASMLLKDAREAERSLREALRLEPTRAEIWRRLGDLQLGEQESPDAAYESYERYLALVAPADADPRVLLNRARILARDEPRRALEAYDQAIDRGAREALGERAHQIDRERGWLFARIEDWSSAFEVLSSWPPESAVVTELEREEVRKFLDETVIPHLLGEASVPTDGRP